MAYTIEKRIQVLQYRDDANLVRTKHVEIGGGNLLMDDDAVDFNAVSKCALMGYWEKINQLDMAKTPDSDSEKNDTARLYFLMTDNTQAHFDIVDPKDELFVATSGEDKNVIKPYADMASLLGNPAENLKEIIDRILGGDILISDGETPHSYLKGRRL